MYITLLVQVPLLALTSLTTNKYQLAVQLILPLNAYISSQLKTINEQSGSDTIGFHKELNICAKAEVQLCPGPTLLYHMISS